MHSYSQEIATRFVAARRSATALTGFPGDLPADLDSAYSIQDIAIGKWPRGIGGWKVGRIPIDVEERFGIDRLAGPVFDDTIHSVADGGIVRMPAFQGGFAAIEAEYVAVIGCDAPRHKTTWTIEDTAEIIEKLCIGLEVASSPLATINELGPTAVVSDFGNNAGLIIGPAIRDWRTRSLDSMSCRSYVDESEVGAGGAFNLTGGYLRSVQFLLELTARRGMPLRAGDAIATGQTTGIHDVRVGQTAKLVFGDDGDLGCAIVAATAA